MKGQEQERAAQLKERDLWGCGVQRHQTELDGLTFPAHDPFDLRARESGAGRGQADRQVSGATATPVSRPQAPYLGRNWRKDNKTWGGTLPDTSAGTGSETLARRRSTDTSRKSYWGEFRRWHLQRRGAGESRSTKDGLEKLGFRKDAGRHRTLSAEDSAETGARSAPEAQTKRAELEEVWKEARRS